jgi:serine/threonine-protein kinase
VRELLRDAGTIQPAIAFEIMHQLLEGLYHAHTHEPCVVHRDVKAENIFLHSPPFGSPCIKVIDFGVHALEGIREEGAFLGTPKYAPPEQLRGEIVTPKADLYSAALILYEMLAGRGPFDQYGDSDRIVKAHLSETAPPIRQFAEFVPRAIEKLLASALAKDPNDRPHDAYAFASKLFELQFVGARHTDVNTTAPTLSTMLTGANVTSAESLLEGLSGTATDRRMAPPSVSGRTLETAQPALEEHPTYSGRFAPPIVDPDRPTAPLPQHGAPNALPTTTQPMPPTRAPESASPLPASYAPAPRPASAARQPLLPVVESEAGIARSVPLKVAPSRAIGRRASRRTLLLLAASAALLLGAGLLAARPTEVALARSNGAAAALVEVARAVPPIATSSDAPPSPPPLSAASSVAAPSTSTAAVAAVPAPARSATVSAWKPAFSPIPLTKPPKDDGANLLFEAP